MSEQTRAVNAVLGVPVQPLTQMEIVTEVIRWTELPRTHVAVGVNAHVCNLAGRDPVFRNNLLAADLCYADGQSLVWAGRALGVAVPERVATTDLIFPLARACAERDKRMFLYGAAPGVAAQAAIQLQAQAPGLRIDSSHGFVPPEELDGLLARIRAHGTDVLLVGLGDPLQQQWITRYRERLGVPAILSCGGLFDWTSGSHRRAPAWMLSSGLEWLWRLMIEPRRLARRYLIGNPEFIARLLAAYLAQRLRRKR